MYIELKSDAYRLLVPCWDFVILENGHSLPQKDLFQFHNSIDFFANQCPSSSPTILGFCLAIGGVYPEFAVIAQLPAHFERVRKDLRKKHPSQLVQAVNYVHHRFEFLFFFSNQVSSFLCLRVHHQQSFPEHFRHCKFPVFIFEYTGLAHYGFFFRTLRTILTSFCVYLYIFSRALLNNIVIYGV